MIFRRSEKELKYSAWKNDGVAIVKLYPTNEE